MNKKEVAEIKEALPRAADFLPLTVCFTPMRTPKRT